MSERARPPRPDPPSRRWTDLRARTISGAALALVAGGALFLGGWFSAALVAAAAFLMAWEYRGVVCSEDAGSDKPTGDGGSLAFGALAACAPLAAQVQHSFAPAVGVVALGAAASIVIDIRNPERWRWTAPGLILLGGSTAAFVSLRDQPMFGLETAIWLVLVVVATDVGGYFAGRVFGGPRLAPTLSPRKTWSGLAGGLALAFLIGGLFSWATTGTYAEEVCVVSLAAAFVAQAGDLAESAFKRRFGVRDSGRLLPGHGGALDRLDGLTAATLVAAAVTFARGREVFIW